MPSINNPAAGDVHVNRPLTNFSQMYMQSQDAFVGLNAFPNLPVDKQSDLYYVFNQDDFYRDEAQERADATESAGSGFTLSTTPYFAKVYAFHKDVTDRQRANQDDPIQLDQSATRYVTLKLMIRRERVFTAQYFATGLWGTDFAGVASAPSGNQFIQWDQSASDPISDVRKALQTVQKNTGYRPNKMLIARTVYDALVDNDAVLARINGGATVDVPAKVLKGLLAALFELDQIFIMDSVVNTANIGATAVTGFVAGKNCLVYYAPDTVGLEEPTAGVQFSWKGLMGSTPNGMRIKRFREERLEADRVEGQMSMDYKLTGKPLGYFFSAAVA